MNFEYIDTLLGKSNYHHSVHLRSTAPAPDPRKYPTVPNQLTYLSNLPFHYDRLKVDVIIATLWKLGKPANGPEEAAATRLFKEKLEDYLCHPSIIGLCMH